MTLLKSIEERKLLYIEKVISAYAVPEEKTWWQHPAPAFHPTDKYTADDHSTMPGEPVLIKKPRNEKLLFVVMFMVASLLIYMIGKKEFGILYVLVLLFLLIVVLPILLNNKLMIRVGREGIWLYKLDKEILWKEILLTYIREVYGEETIYFFVLHYYEENLDEFRSVEIDLSNLVSPATLSASIEAFKPRSLPD